MKRVYRGTIRVFALTCVGLLFWVLGGGTAQAADGDFVWAKTMGDTTGLGAGESIAVNAAGNVCTTGFFSGTVDFDPGVGIFNLTSAGNAFVSKLDANGNFVWAKSLGGAGNSGGLSIDVDTLGSIYIMGYFSNTVDFDPGVGTFNLTAALAGDFFILKLDTNGNFIWVKAWGNIPLNSVAVDVLGNVFATGYFYGSQDFNPGIGVFSLTATASVYDIYVFKLNANGNFVWAKLMAGTSYGFGNSVAVDTSGNIYTTGHFVGTVDFDPGTGTFNLTNVSASYNIFIEKLDANGNFIWAKTMEGSDDHRGFAVDVNASGDVYTTGHFQGTVDFDPGLGIFNLSSAGNSDIFVSKLDINGNFEWAKAMSGTQNELPLSIAVDTAGNVYTTGYFYGTVDFNPDTGIFNLTSLGGNEDIFVTKLDTDGDFVWAKALGGTNNDRGSSIALDAAGNVYTTGYFYDTMDFDPGAGIFNITSTGPNDIFVLKLDGPPPSFIITSSPYFTEVGQTVTISFTASEPLQANPTVTVNTNVATFSSVNGLTYTYTYPVTGADTLGAATIEVTGQDTSGNIGISINYTSLMLVTAGSVPLAAWPGILALAAAGAIVLRRRKK